MKKNLRKLSALLLAIYFFVFSMSTPVLAISAENMSPMHGNVSSLKENIISASIYTRLLKYGMSGDDVRYIQSSLKTLGYLSATPDGAFGRATEASVKIFQAQNGLETPDGMVGSWTFNKIKDAVAANTGITNLRFGSSGTAVKAMQKRLKLLGYLSATPDGVFGRTTEASVKVFQAQHGISTPDGIAGSWSLQTLYHISTSPVQTLSAGLRSAAVKAMQIRLKTLGYLSVVPDGVFGNISKVAVSAFQAKCGLPSPDGIAGAWTLNKLYAYNAPHSTVNVTGISLSQTSLSLTKGDSFTLAATISPSNATNKTVIWGSSNSAVASVANGVIYAKEVGTATITATSVDGNKTASCSVTVILPIIPVSGVTLNKTSISIIVGSSETLTATISPDNATNKSVSWSSSNANVAAVSSVGEVSAIGTGTAIIYARSSNGLTATCTVQVAPIVVVPTNISLNNSHVSMAVGESLPCLIATVEPANANNKVVTFSSDNNGVVTIDSLGKLTAVESGTANITATTSNGLKATCIIYVHKDRVFLSDGIYNIKRKGTSFSLDVNGAGTTNGTNIQLFNNNTTSAQKFRVENINGIVRIWPICAPGKVVDIYRNGAPLVAGQNIDIWILDSSDYIAQEWILTRTYDGSYIIRAFHSSSLTIGSEGNYNCANVKLVEFNVFDENQKFEFEATSDPLQTKLDELRVKFPKGAYWNHVGGSNNPDGYTLTPCTNHNISTATCNGYIYNGVQNAWQCQGFALQLGQDLFGTSPRTWKKVYNLNNLHVGDIIRYKNEGHTVFITGITENGIMIADCNSDLHCKIRWDYYMPLANITGLNYVYTCQ